jgi:hypothetical protein
MVIFQLADLEAARERAAEQGIRAVWEIDLDDISATHLHPADTGGAIVSLDRPDPPESWRWAGPDWIAKAGAGAPGELRGVTIAVPDPKATATRWGGVLGADAESCGVSFVPGDGGLTEISVALPDAVRRGREAVEIGGVRFALPKTGSDPPLLR